MVVASGDLYRVIMCFSLALSSKSDSESDSSTWKRSTGPFSLVDWEWARDYQLTCLVKVVIFHELFVYLYLPSDSACLCILPCVCLLYCMNVHTYIKPAVCGSLLAGRLWPPLLIRVLPVQGCTQSFRFLGSWQCAPSPLVQSICKSAYIHIYWVYCKHNCGVCCCVDFKHLLLPLSCSPSWYSGLLLLGL
jgi:hypothetical protein